MLVLAVWFDTAKQLITDIAYLLLGIAADTWLEIAKSDPDDHALAVTAGRLFERERAAVRRARAGFPDAWAAATKKKVTEWLN